MNLKSSRPGRMGTSRVAEWRVGRLISIIASGKYPNCQTLAREIEVSPKTIQRDIDHMRNQKCLPLEYDGVKHGYYFTRPVSEIAPLQLTRGELVALFIAQKALEPLRGTRLQRLVAESVNKIAAACPEAVSICWEDIDAAYSVKTTGVVAADVSLFMQLMDAVMNRREVTFGYQKLKGGGREMRRVSPYHVGQLQNGWYLIGHDHARGDFRTFALQRVSGLEVQRTRFQRDPIFNMRNYSSSGFGVWGYAADAKRFEVRIRFTGWAACVVVERQWHPSQSISPLKKDGSEIEFCAELAGLEEITRWVISHGRHAKVMWPEELKKKVREELHAALNNAAS
jgi:predicted DNA-binding transcriptional regulator YafY